MNLFKKIISQILIFTLFVCGINSNLIVSAETNNYRQKVIDKFLELGAPETDIDTMTQEEMKIFSEAKQISFDTKYYFVSEKDNTCTTITYNEMKQGIEKEEKNSKSDSAFLSSSYASNTQTSSGGYLEQRVYIATTSTSGKYYVTYRAEWLTDPFWRLTDVFGVAVGNGTIVSGSQSATYQYKQEIYPSTYVSYSEHTYSKSLSNITTFPGGVGAKVELAPGITNSINITNQIFMMSFYVTKSSSSVKNISISGHYLHQEAALSVSPSITGISSSIGICVNYASKFTNMSPNPYTVLYL